MIEKSAVAPVSSWAFWKRRLMRALVILGLALAATQVLPTLPRDQEIEVRLDRGRLREVRITYLEQQRALAGATVKSAPSGTYARHTARLKDGDYTVHAEGSGEDPGGKSRIWRRETPVTLAGELVVIHLD